MKTFFQLNVGLRFLLEVLNTLILIIVGLTKFSVPKSLILGVFVPAICVCIWALLIAPKAKIQLPVVVKFLIECAIFAVVASYLWLVTGADVIIIYLIVVIINSIIAKVGDRR